MSSAQPTTDMPATTNQPTIDVPVTEAHPPTTETTPVQPTTDVPVTEARVETSEAKPTADEPTKEGEASRPPAHEAPQPTSDEQRTTAAAMPTSATQEPTLAQQPAPNPPVQPSDRPAIQSSDAGPARYLGAPPKPAPCHRLTPEEERLTEMQNEQADQYAELHDAQKEHREGEQQKKGFLESIKSAANVVSAKAGAKVTEIQVAMANRLKRKADAADEKWFKECFPLVHEEVKAVYHCIYIDGVPVEHDGKVAVTNQGVHFAVGKKDADLKESVPYKLVASIEMAGMPPQLNVYSTDGLLYQFKHIRLTSGHSEVEDMPITEAYNWMDHCWRAAAGDETNPAAFPTSS